MNAPRFRAAAVALVACTVTPVATQQPGEGRAGGEPPEKVGEQPAGQQAGKPNARDAEMARMLARVLRAQRRARELREAELGPESPVATVAAYLDSDGLELRLRAARALGHRGVAAAAALPELERQLKEVPEQHPPGTDLDVKLDDHRLRRTFARAIVAIDPASRSVAARTALLQLGDDAERRAAAMALSNAEIEALPALRRALRAERDIRVLREVVTAVGTLGPAARDAAAELDRLSQHRDPQLRARAAAARRQLDK